MAAPLLIGGGIAIAALLLSRKGAGAAASSPLDAPSVVTPTEAGPAPTSPSSSGAEAADMRATVQTAPAKSSGGSKGTFVGASGGVASAGYSGGKLGAVAGGVGATVGNLSGTENKLVKPAPSAEDQANWARGWEGLRSSLAAITSAGQTTGTGMTPRAQAKAVEDAAGFVGSGLVW